MTDLIRNKGKNWLKNWHGSIPFHSVLIAVYVCLLPYAENQDELFFDSVLSAIVIAIAAAAVLVSLFWVALGNGCAAGVMSTLIIVCLAYYGHVFDAIDDLVGGPKHSRRTVAHLATHDSELWFGWPSAFMPANRHQGRSLPSR